mgnify:CR=1 FL=1
MNTKDIGIFMLSYTIQHVSKTKHYGRYFTPYVDYTDYTKHIHAEQTKLYLNRDILKNIRVKDALGHFYPK